MPPKKVDRAPHRKLPTQRNPLLASDAAPERMSFNPISRNLVQWRTRLLTSRRLLDTELVKRRRLGQTKLEVQPSQIGLNDAAKPEHLGMFDYAHLRVPLPKDLKGSEIFAPQQHQHPPESYFLMVCAQRFLARRWSDGREDNARWT